MNKNHFFISSLTAWLLCAAASAEVDLPALDEKAQGGDAQAQYALGVIYYMGDGVKKDSVKAAQYFLKAAEQGDERARHFLEVVYMRGEGALPGASSETLHGDRRAVEQVVAPAQNNARGCAADAEGKLLSFEEAVRYFKLAVNPGNDVTPHVLGEFYRDAWEEEKQRYTEAVERCRPAAEQGNSRAQWYLGVCYETGRGVEQSYTEAVKWYRLAAEQGYAQAQLHLGRCYEAGNGVPQSDAEAVRWYKLAADQGHDEAQYRLGLCYYHGKGVEANCSEAVLWLKCAAAQGDSAAADFLRELGVEP